MWTLKLTCPHLRTAFDPSRETQSSSAKDEASLVTQIKWVCAFSTVNPLFVSIENVSFIINIQPLGTLSK